MASSSSEDIRCIATLVGSLETSLEYYVKGMRMQGQSLAHEEESAAPPSAVVDPLEASEFINLIVSVSKRCHEEDTLQSILFDASVDVLKTLSLFINAPMRYAPVQRLTVREDAANAFANLRLLAIGAIKRLVVLCSTAAAADSNSAHLVHLCTAAIRRYGIVDELILQLKAPLASESIRRAVAECVLVICVHGGTDSNSLLMTHFADLMPMAVLEVNEEVRGFICAICREMTGRDPTNMAIVSAIPSFLKLVQLDDSSDVRALCVASLDSILRSHLAPEVAARKRPELAEMLRLSPMMETLISRFESRGDNEEVLEVLCRALESLLLVSSEIGHDEVFKLAHDQGAHTHLLPLLERREGLASFAIRAIRTLIERAPPHLSLAPSLATAGSLELLLAAVSRVSANPLFGSSDESTDAPARAADRIAIQMLAVELAVTVGLMLLYSPQVRRKFALAVHGGELQQSASELSAHLNTALTQGAIDYFQEILIVDEEGLILNDTNCVEWESESQPAQRSLHGIIDAQEIRRSSRPAGTARWKAIQELRAPDIHRGYLAFVLLGYVVFRVLRFPANTGRSLNRTAVTNAATPSSFQQGATTMEESAIYRTSGGDLSPSGRLPRPQSGSPKARGVGGQYEKPEAGARRPMFPTSRDVTSANFVNTHTQQQAALERSLAAETKGDRTNQFEPTDPLRAHFQSCFSLCSALARHYRPTGKEVERTGTTYVAAGGGLVMRSQKARKKNPWDPKPVQRDHTQWTVDAVDEGDLFFFSIPLEALTPPVIDAIVGKADKHSTLLKKSFVTTPQRMRGRRCFLNDMLTAVMPQVATLLRRLAAFLEAHSDGHVQMALSALPDVRDEHLEKTVNPGNIVRCIDYLTHHFARSVPTAANLSTLPKASMLTASPIPMLGSEDALEYDLDGGGGGGGGSGHGRSSIASPGRHNLSELGARGKVGGTLFHDLSNTSVSDSSSDGGF